MGILDTSSKDYSLIEKYTRHGGAYDRGDMDKYYLRNMSPHYFIGDTYQSLKIEIGNMTYDEIAAYEQGYEDHDESDFKQY